MARASFRHLSYQHQPRLYLTSHIDVPADARMACNRWTAVIAPIASCKDHILTRKS